MLMNRLALAGIIAAILLGLYGCQNNDNGIQKASGSFNSYRPPENSRSELYWVRDKKISPVSKSYKDKFDECDRQNTFGGKFVGARGCFNDKNGNGKLDPEETHDRNSLKHLIRIEGKRPAILYQSKMSLDMDGGYLPCVKKDGSTNQCATSYRYITNGLSAQYESEKRKYGSDFAIPNARLKRYFEELFVQSDIVTYTVLPGGDSGEFSRLTGAKTGDLGVVIYNGVVVPVFVADRGPYFRLGEASLRVFERVGASRCKDWDSSRKRYCKSVRNVSIGKNVTTIIFPDSALPRNRLTPKNVNSVVKKEALRLYQATKGSE